MLKTLRRKLILFTMIPLTLMLAVILTMLCRITDGNLQNDSTQMARTLAQSALESGVADEGSEDIPLPYFTVRSMGNGNAIVSGKTDFPIKDGALMQTLLSRVYAEDVQAGVLREYHLRYYKATSFNAQSVAFVDISSQQATLRTLIELCIVIGTVSLAAFWGISWFLARWALKPVEKAWDQQRQFVSDASHELKTPLTVIMSSAELLQDPACDEENIRRFSGNILTVSRQMRKLVEQLLELARADNGQVKKVRQTVDMSALVTDSLLLYEPVLYEHGMTLSGTVEPHILCTGSGQYLRQLAGILLDNAVKYGMPGVVTVELTASSKHTCLLTAENEGTPLTQEQTSKIFDRFYRMDTSRESNGSYGLGLAIAKSIVTEHGGRIWAEPTQRGNRFCIRLPMQ